MKTETRRHFSSSVPPPTSRLSLYLSDSCSGHPTACVCVSVHSVHVALKRHYEIRNINAPLLGFHLKYFCLGYLIGGPGKNIKNESEQIALTGTLPTLSLDNIDLSSSPSLREIITDSGGTVPPSFYRFSNFSSFLSIFCNLISITYCFQAT